MLLDSVQRNSGKGFINDSIIIKLQSEHDLIIGYSRYNYDWGDPDKYNLLLLKNHKWTALKYYRKEVSINYEPFFTWDTVAISTAQIDTILNIFRVNKGWNLTCFEEWGLDYCPSGMRCYISDAGSTRLIMMTKTNLQTAAFYAPFFLEACCPEYSDRSRFISIVSPIARIFNDTRIR